MAATAMTPAQLELIESLSQDDIPIKLRCAICSKLAVNAFRLPCCEQAICENCQNNLPSSCPVCEHSPVTSDDCTPHKSLRTTIKVFLRTEEKKRGALLAKAAKETPPETPVEEVSLAQISEVAQQESIEDVAPATNGQEKITAQKAEVNTSGVQEDSFESTDSVEFILSQQNSQDIPQKSIEEIAPGQEPEEDKSNVDDASTGTGEGDPAETTVAGAQTSNMFAMPGMGMNPMMGMMGNMGEMNQMQQMQMMMAMQSGMSGFGGFPIMGMPGMSMDPMTMQQMYMNGGFGGGMNNMGAMGGSMGGMNNGNGNQGGGYGQQGQSWNVNGSGGDNFNVNVAAGHNDFASSHYPNRGGFNRGGFGGRGGFNEFGGHQGDFYGRGRGRGRGRGGFGRGGYQGQFGGNGGFDNAMNPMEQMKQMMGDQNQQVTFKENEDAQPKTNVDEFGREIRAATPEEDAKAADNGADGEVFADANGDIPTDQQKILYDQNGEYVENYGPDVYGQGYDMNGNYNQLHPGQGYEYKQNNMPQLQVDVPLNAPKGPKAMREGLPNTSLVNLKGRSGSSGRPYSSGSGANNTEVADRSARQYDKEREEYARQREERHKSRDRSRDRDEHRSSRRHRDRDEETSDDARESERRRERRRRRREEAEAAAAEEGKDTDMKDGDAAVDEDTESGSKRDSHRSSRRDKDRSDRTSDRDRHRDRSRHRDRDDKDRERTDRDRSDRDKEKSSRSSRSERDSKHHSSSYRHRDRSRSRSRDKEDSKSSRSSRRDRDRDFDRDRDSHRSRRHREKEEPAPPVLKPPTGPRSMSIFDKGPVKGGGIQIKGASSRGKENSSIPKGPKAKDKEVDPHTAEREARNRERLLKEAQRMAGLAGLVGVPPPASRGKREREDERGGHRKRRGRGHGMDGADDDAPEDGEEERIRKNELEREGARGR